MLYARARLIQASACFVLLKVEVTRIVMVEQVLLILSLIISTHAPSVQRESGGRVPNARLIGNISKVAAGCGCYFRSAGEDASSERYIFFADASEAAPLMNIGGRDVRLRLISSTERPGGVRRKGERFSRRYAAGDIKIRMSFVATSVCPSPYDPECAANNYDVTLTASKGARRQTVKAVGGCGC